MSNYNIKLNMAAFKHSVKKMKGKPGPNGEERLVECLVIPLEANHLFRGEKGLYMDITAIEVKQPKFDDTHLLKQGLPKDVYDKLTEDEKKATPIFGNMGPWKGGSEPTLAAPEDEDSDLPF
jgi:hypothetical protein